MATHRSAEPLQEAGVLTIGQLAAHVGVTARAIRHYHQRGLLAEPPRDASGYRRYGAHAVADLIRIKVLADAGVPLAHVRQLLASDLAEFTTAVAKLDRALQDRISELEHRRRQLAGLMAGERLVLPAEVARLLDEMRALGVSERTLTVERDGWTLLMALSPEGVPAWAADKCGALADPDFRHLYLAWEEAHDWDPGDPRLAKLAAEAVSWIAQRPPTPPPEPDAGVAAAYSLLSAQLDASSPAWRRLDELCRAQLKSHGRSAKRASHDRHQA
jgi:DNA-binding transcriptional MerR regulator